MMDLFFLIESAAEPERGGDPVDSKDSPKKGAVKSRKSRARIYNTLKHATQQAKVGDIVSTKGADRLYVISKASWGAKSSGKIAKGFTPGSSTPSSEFPSIKAHAARTRLKHGAGSGRLRKLYGPGAKNKIKNSKKSQGKK